MAISNKGARTIVVDEVRYRWRASGTDEGISLYVWQENVPNCVVGGRFCYSPDRQLGVAQIVITARIVRKFVQLAVAESLFGKEDHWLGAMDERISMKDALQVANGPGKRTVIDPRNGTESTFCCPDGRARGRDCSPDSTKRLCRLPTSD